MRKALALFVSVLFLSFSGCASKSATADEALNAPQEKEISTYLLGAYVDVDTAKSKLAEAGFEVLGAYKSFKKGTTIVFTNDALKAAADKPQRGFAAVLRLLVDDERQQISITNPVYFGKAFLQDDYKHADAVAIQKSLKEAFGELKGSVDKWEFEGLADYHFMMGMPYYKEVYVLGEGENAALLEKARSYKKGKNLLFELKLSDNRTLLGYELSKRTSKFVNKTGTQNANILPYTVLIEDGQAKALAGKYYIAISYPLLSMGQFMKIATIPGAIEKDLKKPFK
jgi:hypothetical protein